MSPKKKDPWTYALIEDGTTINEEFHSSYAYAIGLRELSEKDRRKFTSFHNNYWNDEEYMVSYRR